MMKKIIKILLIDDDEFIRMLIRDIFWVHGKGGCQVYSASTIEEGEEILKKQKIDLIFLDLFIKEGGGLKAVLSLAFLEKIKSDIKTKNIKVIIFSGYPDLKKRALELGAEKFLLKGEYLPKELFEITNELIKKQ